MERNIKGMTKFEHGVYPVTSFVYSQDKYFIGVATDRSTGATMDESGRLVVFQNRRVLTMDTRGLDYPSSDVDRSGKTKHVLVSERIVLGLKGDESVMRRL
jgi:hypothetical protein